jgi:hypothetical protein
MHRLCERVGVKYHSPHKLRHGHAAYAIKQAKTVAESKAISQNLMHSNLSTTDGTYGVLSQQDVGDTISGLGVRAPLPAQESPTGLDLDALAQLIADKMQQRGSSLQ